MRYHAPAWSSLQRHAVSVAHLRWTTWNAGLPGQFERPMVSWRPDQAGELHSSAIYHIAAKQKFVGSRGY